MFFVYRIPH